MKFVGWPQAEIEAVANDPEHPDREEAQHMLELYRQADADEEEARRQDRIKAHAWRTVW